jgi:uncharacterized protein (TIGR04562 family)
MNRSFLKPYDFRWDVLDIIIGGKSSIDSHQGFQINTPDEAERFLLSYGLDLRNPIESAETLGHFHEALSFIRRYFLFPENQDGLKLEVPRKILELTNVRDLFLMASFSFPSQSKDSTGTILRNWACSILKVMHTIAHVDQDIRTVYFADIQKQILDRFYRVIHRDEKGGLFLGEADDPTRVELKAFETKPKKSRDSTLLKLLHKPENVAEDIFDRVGIRFITTTPLGALRVVKYLKDQMIVMPPNIKPSRSRNTLIDLEAFRMKLGQLTLRLERNEITDQQYHDEVNQAATSLHHDHANPHSSSFYRSIQFTARQLIKLRNPLFDDMKELKSILKTQGLPEAAAKIIERVDTKYLQKEIRFFYPYEVQVVDVLSHEENEKGRSAHSEYKKAQLQTAMKRVMGPLVDASR